MARRRPAPYTWWWSWIKEGLKAGMSGNQILRLAQEQGFGIRRKTFFQIMREVLASEAWREIVAPIPFDQKIPIRLIPRTGMKLPARFQYVVRAVFQGIEMKWSVHSDIPLSKAEILDLGTQIASARYGIALLPEEMEVIYARRRS